MTFRKLTFCTLTKVSEKKSVMWTGSGGEKNSGETGLKGLDEEPGTVYATTVQRNRISSGIIYDCKLKLKNLWKKKS